MLQYYIIFINQIVFAGRKTIRLENNVLLAEQRCGPAQAEYTRCMKCREKSCFHRRYFLSCLLKTMDIKTTVYLVLGWFIPGFGHLALKKYARGIIFFICISAMAVMGLVMGGKIYSFQTENPLTILAFFSDLGIGLLYFISKVAAIGIGHLKNVTFEFGTAYIAGAGLLNYLVALDALDIARGRKK